jgi:predicted P-loop ATPase
MIAAVARAMRPGCKVDDVLVLIGEQGVGKSTFFDVLAGEWFTDTPVNIGDKDGKLVMRKAWIVEWAELESMRRAKDQEAIKGFLSAKVDLFRKPYGRDVVEAPRHCVIVGTTNNREFLHDPSGNRRFWPLEVKNRIDVEWLRANRSQLWAEAVALFRSGEQWFLTHEENEQLREVQREHEHRDVWADPIADYLHSQGLLDEVTTTHLLKEAVGVDVDKMSDRDSKRVAAIMKPARLDARRVRIGNEVRRGYVRPKVIHVIHV